MLRFIQQTPAGEYGRGKCLELEAGICGSHVETFHKIKCDIAIKKGIG